MPSKPADLKRHGQADGDRRRSWIRSLGLALAVGLAYFLVARVSLALLTPSDGVAVFWPAAGIASGLLIALGPSSRFPVAAGVMLATVAANLLGDRNLAASMVFGLCNAGEALLIAWLIATRFGSDFSLGSLRSVLGFIAAIVVGTAISGAGGTAGFVLFHDAGAPPLDIWRNWLASDALGAVAIAPVIIGLRGILRHRPDRAELAEGMLVLLAIALVSAIAFASPADYWPTLSPLTPVLPLLLWPAARCRPVFAAAAASVLTLGVVWTLTFGIGRFGDASVALGNRVHDARVSLLVTSVIALVLAALFAERRRSEAALRETNDRLSLALSGARLGAFSTDVETGRLECDARAAFIHGHSAMPESVREGRRFVHPDDLRHVDSAFAEAEPANGTWSTEYRVIPPPGHEHAGKVRWVALDGSILRNAKGKPVRMLGVARDITERKCAEDALRNQEEAYRRLLGALPAAIYTTDAAGRITYCNQAAIDMWGMKPELGKDNWCDTCRFYHPDGAPMPLDTCPTQICLETGRGVPGREAILERSDGTRIFIVPYPTPLTDETGKAVGVVNMTVDITDRKRAELALSEREALLGLAQKIARVGSYAFDNRTGIIQLSPACATIYGLPESTTQFTRGDWRKRVHPDDLARLDAERRQAFAARRDELVGEFRMVRAGGEIRWIEARNLISYDADGRPLRMVGVNIDVTERRQAEDHKTLLIAELDHRVKNALACFAVIAQHARESSRSMDEFLEVLNGRIKSLANTHALLSRSRWLAVSLGELVRSEIAPCTREGNTVIEGPDIDLTPEATQAVAMVLHELATNAAKYGALSNGRGRVSVCWELQSNGTPSGGLTLEWRENGGPQILSAGANGYGTTVIRDLIPYELGGSVDYALVAEGARCKLQIPAKWVRTQNLSRDSLNGAAGRSRAGLPPIPFH
jgi:PAS domain S-box-containing protein